MNKLRGRIAQMAATHRLPSIFAFRQHAEAGGLMSYEADLLGAQRRAAYYVDEILKGAKPEVSALEMFHQTGDTTGNDVEGFYATTQC
jgi:putative ABC transport system substrate-binding protein